VYGNGTVATESSENSEMTLPRMNISEYVGFKIMYSWTLTISCVFTTVSLARLGLVLVVKL